MYRCEADNFDGSFFGFDKAEEHHQINVIRIKDQSPLQVWYNGQLYDCIYNLKLKKAKKIQNIVLTDESSKIITLIVSLINWNRLEWLIEKSTEIGINKIIVTQFDKTQKYKFNQESKLERWNKIAKAAFLQSNGLIIPQIQFIDDYKKIELPKETKKIVLTTTNDASQLTHQNEILLDKNIAFVIGPEADFMKSEIDYLKDNAFIPFFIKGNILKSETAAIYILSILRLS